MKKEGKEEGIPRVYILSELVCSSRKRVASALDHSIFNGAGLDYSKATEVERRKKNPILKEGSDTILLDMSMGVNPSGLILFLSGGPIRDHSPVCQWRNRGG
ncbi:hypothetical protein AWENTII_007629 [Aspergillus wentii]